MKARNQRRQFFRPIVSNAMLRACVQVQRVPANSTRLHTSAASVVVMMEADAVDVSLDPR